MFVIKNDQLEAIGLGNYVRKKTASGITDAYFAKIEIVKEVIKIPQGIIVTKNNISKLQADTQNKLSPGQVIVLAEKEEVINIQTIQKIRSTVLNKKIFIVVETDLPIGTEVRIEIWGGANQNDAPDEITFNPLSEILLGSAKEKVGAHEVPGIFNTSDFKDKVIYEFANEPTYFDQLIRSIQQTNTETPAKIYCFLKIESLRTTKATANKLANEEPISSHFYLYSVENFFEIVLASQFDVRA